MASNIVTSPQDYAQPKHRANGGAPAAEAAPNYSLHPKAQEAAAVFSDAMRELDNHREIVRAMQHKIDVQEDTIRELQYQLDRERQMKETFQRYGTKAQTLIHSMAALAAEADAAAMDAAHLAEPPKPIEPPKPTKATTKTETEVEAAIAQLRETHAPQ